MSNPFRTQIRKALANPHLQIALDNNAERRTKVRLESYASLPEDIQVMRRRAHELRAKVIAQLPQYLDEFIDNVEHNGIIVHRAANADQAVQAMLDIAQEHNAHLIAKSKTMVGEEIELNPALEKHGYQVVETDLGEYIVQIRGEHPAHIITPAVHLTREDVGQTFHEKLGIPLTDDVPTIVAVARRTLRDIFLKADIGISGVNLGVAENGTLCVLTNEGNGRMVTTIPPVHIALMGIERLVPSMEDLALLLRLLPRSATGQKLTVYSNLIRSPGTNGENPRQRHLILLDNGRMSIRNSPFNDILFCIRCGSCMNACPVFREISGHGYVGVSGKNTPYPGPMGSALSPALFSYAEFGHLARASSLCGACKEACPVDIDLPTLLLRHRAGITLQSSPTQKPVSNAPGYLKFGLKFFAWISTSPARFQAAQNLAGVGSRLLAPVSPWIRFPAFTGWGISKDFPRPYVKPFHARWNEIASQDVPITAIKDTAAVSAPESSSRQPAEEKPTQSLVQRFSKEWQSVGGYYISCTKSSLGQKILEILQKNQVDSIQAWEQSYLPEGLLDFLQSKGIHVENDSNPKLHAGITGALCAVAETGTLVIPSEPGRPITASLLPDIHITVLPARDIQDNLSQALQSLKNNHAPTIVLVSGPSRTADIEMTLSIGVHGPCQVFVCCLEDEV